MSLPENLATVDLAAVERHLEVVDQRMQNRMNSGAQWGATERSVVQLAAAVRELASVVRFIVQDSRHGEASNL